MGKGPRDRQALPPQGGCAVFPTAGCVPGSPAHPHNPDFTPACYPSEHPCLPHPTSPIWDPHPPDPNHGPSPCVVPDSGTPTSPLARTHAGGPVAGTDPLSVQLLPNLPGEERRLLPLQLRDPCHHLGGGRAGLAAPDGFGLHGPRPVEAAQDLADAAVGHLRHGEAGGCSVGRFLGGDGGKNRDPNPRPRRTLRLREMSEVRTPQEASSMIRCLLQAGRGRPFTKSPPSWLTALGPGERTGDRGGLCRVKGWGLRGVHPLCAGGSFGGARQWD